MPTAEEKKVLQRMKKTSKGAYKKAKTKEPKVKGQQLPGGITKGIARFTDYKLALDKNNAPYVMLTGVVVTPKEHEGARANRSHFLSSSEWKSIEEKYDELFSDLQLLGINTSEMDDTTVLEESMEQLALLKEEKTPFYFNTWKRNEESDTVVFLQGLCDEELPEDEEEEEEEEDDEEEEEDEYVEDDEEEEEYEDDEEVEDEEEGEDEEYEEEDDEDEEDDEEDEEEDGEWVPEKGDTYNYAINSKAIPFPCDVTAVSSAKQTVSIKRQKDDKLFKGVSWDKLQDAEDEEE